MSGLEAYIHGPAEIEKTLDHGVQAVDFLVQNLDRLQSVAVLIVRERLFEILEPQAHGVQRIFYFVRDASGDAAKRGEALADLQLRVDAFERIEIAQSDQRAHAFAVFLNGLHADADAFEPFGGLQFGFRGDFAELIAIEVQRLAQWVAGRENLGDAAAEKLSGFAAEKFLRRGTDHHGAASRVKSSRPSSSPAMTEFMFSRRVLKISWTPRSCWPTWVILRLTWPISSLSTAKPARPFICGAGASNCPAEMRSSCAEILRKGASAAPLTIAARRVEMTSATPTMVAEERMLGARSSTRRPEESTTRTSPNGCLLTLKGKPSSYWRSAPRITLIWCKNPRWTSWESGVRCGSNLPGRFLSVEIRTIPSLSTMESSYNGL